MMYRVTRKETYVTFVSATSEDSTWELVNEMSNGDSEWLSTPDDTEIQIELFDKYLLEDANEL